MLERIANGNHETYIGIKAVQVAQARDAVVALREIARRSTYRQQFAHMRGMERFKHRIVRVGIEDLFDLRVVHRVEEMHPQYFLECLRAVRSDRDTVAVRSLACAGLRQRQARTQRIPPVRRPDGRIVAVAMRGERRVRVQCLEQDCAARSRESADVDRPVDPHALDRGPEDACLEIAERFAETWPAREQRADPALAPRHTQWDAVSAQRRSRRAWRASL